MEAHDISLGQQQARTRWGTHESGSAFDRKKTSHLIEQARTFIAQQAICVIAGTGPQNELCGLITVGQPGFVETPDEQTCLLQLHSQIRPSRLMQGLRQSSHVGRDAQIGLFFISHPTRERLCVQGSATVVSSNMRVLDHNFVSHEETLVCLHVQKVFFHCPKYIKTQIVGLTAQVEKPFEQKWWPSELLNCRQTQTYLSDAMQAFIAQQVLCFLCTVDQHGQCAVNHRGGAQDFLVVLPPDATSPGGTVLLPDYAGNGAFEALGNILETGRAAFIVPNYAAQLALCISGWARIVELEELPSELVGRCIGAERVVALSVQRVETQHGDWSAALAYERARAETIFTREEPVTTCYF